MAGVRHRLEFPDGATVTLPVLQGEAVVRNAQEQLHFAAQALSLQAVLRPPGVWEVSVPEDKACLFKLHAHEIIEAYETHATPF